MWEKTQMLRRDIKITEEDIKKVLEVFEDCHNGFENKNIISYDYFKELKLGYCLKNEK